MKISMFRSFAVALFLFIFLAVTQWASAQTVTATYGAPRDLNDTVTFTATTGYHIVSVEFYFILDYIVWDDNTTQYYSDATDNVGGTTDDTSYVDTVVDALDEIANLFEPIPTSTHAVLIGYHYRVVYNCDPNTSGSPDNGTVDLPTHTRP